MPRPPTLTPRIRANIFKCVVELQHLTGWAVCSNRCVFGVCSLTGVLNSHVIPLGSLSEGSCEMIEFNRLNKITFFLKMVA